MRATGARGRGAGWKRPSRRPSGPGKMTSGMGLRLLACNETVAPTGAPRRRFLYRGGTSSGNRQISAKMTQRIYLDHASTTPVIAAAREAFVRGLDGWANPNSPHGEGRGSRALLEEARDSIRSSSRRERAKVSSLPPAARPRKGVHTERPIMRSSVTRWASTRRSFQSIATA